MLRTKIVALGAAALISLLSPTVASARGGFHGGGFHGGGWGPGLGVGVGLGLVGAYAAFGPYGYGAYPYGYGGYYGAPYAYSGYYGEGGCYLVRHRVWTPFGWRLRPVQVCG
jgi:hypothetical protein